LLLMGLMFGATLFFAGFRAAKLPGGLPASDAKAHRADRRSEIDWAKAGKGHMDPHVRLLPGGARLWSHRDRKC